VLALLLVVAVLQQHRPQHPDAEGEQGRAVATLGDFLVYDAKDGRELYRFPTGGPVAAGISTYNVGGKQYVAVPSGNSSRDAASATGAATMVIFTLD